MNPLKIARNWVASIIMLMPAVALSLTSDSQQPLHVTSNSANLNYKAGVLTYTGNVEATQGTRQLNGDRLIVYRSNKGQIEKVTVFGKPAKYRGLPDVGKPMVHAEALSMVYQPQANLITFTDNAKLEQNGNISKAPIITYNTLTEVVSTPETEQGRTTMIIQPYSQQQ